MGNSSAQLYVPKMFILFRYNNNMLAICLKAPLTVKKYILHLDQSHKINKNNKTNI